MLQILLCWTLANFTDITQRGFERVAVQMPHVLGEGSDPAAIAVFMITWLCLQELFLLNIISSLNS